jgi:hypothetical protein
LNFHQENPLKNKYLPHLSFENCEINFVKFDPTKGFPTTPRTPPNPYNVQFLFNLNFIDIMV